MVMRFCHGNFSPPKGRLEGHGGGGTTEYVLRVLWIIHVLTSIVFGFRSRLFQDGAGVEAQFHPNTCLHAGSRLALACQ